MNSLWLGALKEDAQCVFLLPNKPTLPIGSHRVPIVEVDAALLIELNGNHWRKILTIMAKLTVPNYNDWRNFRDGELLSKVGVAFDVDQLIGYQGTLFIVGNTFRDVLPIPESAFEVGDRHIATFSLPHIWCPYLDYRQFPNILIERAREIVMEKPC